MDKKLKISEIFDPSTIRIPLQARGKEEIITDLVQLLKETEKIESAQEALEAVIERERYVTTGIGRGFAIPHGKCRGVEDVAVALAISKEGVDFEAMDKRPVEIIVLLVSHPQVADLHLHFISNLTRIFKDPELKSALLTCRTSEEVYLALQSYDEKK